MKIWPAIVASFLILAGSGSAKAGDSAAVVLVQRYGADTGGRETIASLVELNLKDWKPQSPQGIEIFGWHLDEMQASEYRVSYSYREHGRPTTVLAWIVDMDSRRIRPLNDLSERLMKMACLL